MVRKVVFWWDSLPVQSRIFVSSLLQSVPFYLAAIATYVLGEDVHLKGWPELIFHGIVVIVLLTVVNILRGLFNWVHDQAEAERALKDKARLFAYDQIDRCSSELLKQVSKGSPPPDHFVNSLVASVNDLKNIVDAAYRTFEAVYGPQSGSADRINFEVTFMTRSYVDHLITIPACINREGIEPASMRLRANNPNIYAGTVTDQIYQEQKPRLHIVESTRDQRSNYSELYAGQKDKLQSTIIAPVVSSQHILLGTMVVHCDRDGFFKEADRKFWTDISSIFTGKLAVVKMKLDILDAQRQRTGDSLEISIPPAAF
jgi:hypothetical protein